MNAAQNRARPVRHQIFVVSGAALASRRARPAGATWTGWFTLADRPPPPRNDTWLSRPMSARFFYYGQVSGAGSTLERKTCEVMGLPNNGPKTETGDLGSASDCRRPCTSSCYSLCFSVPRSVRAASSCRLLNGPW